MVKGRFDHFNINVTNLERSIAFYAQALGLKEHHRKEAEDGSFILVYLTDETTSFLMELTWLRDKEGAYELGDNESHLCFRVGGDYDEARAYHKAMGAVCYENEAMGLSSCFVGQRTKKRPLPKMNLAEGEKIAVPPLFAVQ